MTIVMKTINRTYLPNLCAKKRERRRKAGTSISNPGSYMTIIVPIVEYPCMFACLKPGTGILLHSTKLPGKKKGQILKWKNCYQIPLHLERLGLLSKSSRLKKNKSFMKRSKQRWWSFKEQLWML